ncbi:hypothetical protein HYC85_013782 [Camellia sinensis]|uniref:Uncharacterized protein n=1 Tax=Camellia sinensis TaxID=4442 RepID=A0A7J7H5M5_CAMSI|nr:hypothetical protein HYC85_013782 [Camellia sinensis]
MLGGAVSIISTAREDWSPVVDSSDKNEEETPKISVRIKGRSDDDTLNSFQRSQADWIRQYVEQQEEVPRILWQNSPHSLSACTRSYKPASQVFSVGCPKNNMTKVEF